MKDVLAPWLTGRRLSSMMGWLHLNGQACARPISCLVGQEKCLRFQKTSTLQKILTRPFSSYTTTLILGELLCSNPPVQLPDCISAWAFGTGKPGQTEDFLYFLYSPATVSYFSSASSLFLFHIPLFPVPFTDSPCYLLPSRCFLSPAALHFLSLSPTLLPVFHFLPPHMHAVNSLSPQIAGLLNWCNLRRATRTALNSVCLNESGDTCVDSCYIICTQISYLLQDGLQSVEMH